MVWRGVCCYSGQKYINQLSSTLHNPLIERFIQALDNFTNPEVTRCLSMSPGSLSRCMSYYSIAETEGLVQSNGSHINIGKEM